MAFVHKSINPSTHIGADLRELRERAGLSRAQAAQQTKITESFLEALEEERWGEIGDAIYAERILRAYLRFLGGKEKYFLEKYHDALKERLVERDPAAFIPRPRHIKRFDLAVSSRLLTIVSFVVFSLLLGGYVYFQVRLISTPPKLMVTQPVEGEQEDGPRVEVRGTTLPDALVLINGKQPPYSLTVLFLPPSISLAAPPS